MDYRTKRRAASLAVHFLLGLIVLVCLFPILWMCLIAFKDTKESLTGFHSLWVDNPTLDNFKRLFQLIPVWQNTFNSVFTTIIGTVTSLFFCALAGFAFSKYRFPALKKAASKPYFAAKSTVASGKIESVYNPRPCGIWCQRAGFPWAYRGLT